MHRVCSCSADITGVMQVGVHSVLPITVCMPAAGAGAVCCRYDKPGTMSKGRKIGHINIVAPTRAEARQRLAAIEAAGEQALRRSDAAAQQAGLLAVGAAGSGSSGGQQQAGSRDVKAAAAGPGGFGGSGKKLKVCSASVWADHLSAALQHTCVHECGTKPADCGPVHVTALP